MTTINAAAQARQKLARETDGKFGNQLHNESSVALTGPAGTAEISRLHEFANAQDSSTDGRGLANQARLAVAARLIHVGLPEAASFSLDRAEGGYVVAGAWDARGYQLDEDGREHIVKILRESRVGYIHTPVGLAAARTWDPDTVSLTSPKITSKGRTVFVTMPDGAVADRTSKSREYTHAVIGTPEDPELVKAKHRRLIAEQTSVIADIDEALGAEKLKVRSKQRFRGDRDPDVDYQGEPTFNGFEYNAYSADGKRILETVWGNSKQETRGGYDESGQYDGDKPGKAFGELGRRLQEKRNSYQGYNDTSEATIKAVEDGTYNLGEYAAWGFSASAANAEKTARSNESTMETRRYYAQEIDK